MKGLLLLSLHLCASSFTEPADWAYHLSAERRAATFGALKSIGGADPPQLSTTVQSATSDPMQLVMFDEATVSKFGARTLDGSPSGYYYREGAEKDSFVIFLQGGGLCVEPVDCKKRSKTHLGSSKYWASTKQDDSNVLSTDASFNPFANWSHVFVPYGSGDVWIGTQKSANDMGLHFSGHNTLEAMVHTLLNSTALGSAQRILLTGASAGGIGTFQNADWMHEMLLSAGAQPEYRAAPQAGSYFVNQDIDIYPEFATLGSHITNNFAAFAASYMYAWFGVLSAPLGPKPFLDQSCILANPSTPHQCWSAVWHYEYINSSLFVAQNKFDSNQAGSVFGVDWWPLPLRKVSKNATLASYKRYWGKKSLSGIAAAVMDHGSQKVPQDGIFMPSCWQHTGNLCMKGGSVVKGTVFSQSLWSWFHNDNAVAHQLIDDCEGDDPCNPMCDC